MDAAWGALEGGTLGQLARDTDMVIIALADVERVGRSNSRGCHIGQYAGAVGPSTLGARQAIDATIGFNVHDFAPLWCDVLDDGSFRTGDRYRGAIAV